MVLELVNISFTELVCLKKEYIQWMCLTSFSIQIGGERET
jgi:hypothetical protein